MLYRPPVLVSAPTQPDHQFVSWVPLFDSTAPLNGRSTIPDRTLSALFPTELAASAFRLLSLAITRQHCWLVTDLDVLTDSNIASAIDEDHVAYLSPSNRFAAWRELPSAWRISSSVVPLIFKRMTSSGINTIAL